MKAFTSCRVSLSLFIYFAFPFLLLTHPEFQQYAFDPCWLYHWSGTRLENIKTKQTIWTLNSVLVNIWNTYNHLHPAAQAQIFLNCIHSRALLARLSSPWEWMLLKHLFLVAKAERVNLNGEEAIKMYRTLKSYLIYIKCNQQDRNIKNVLPLSLYTWFESQKWVRGR